MSKLYADSDDLYSVMGAVNDLIDEVRELKAEMGRLKTRVKKLEGTEKGGKGE